MKIYKLISNLGIVSFILLGLVTVYSLINDPTVVHINLIMGGIFLTIGGFLFFKRKSIIKLISEIKDLNNENSVTSATLTRFLFFEILFVFTWLLLGLIMLYGAISRTFIENLPIFG